MKIPWTCVSVELIHTVAITYLLHLSCVLSTKDDHLLLGEVDSNRCGRGHTAGISVGGESTTVVDDVVRVEVLQLLSRGADQHVAHEESVVRAGADNADAYSVALIPSCEAVDDIDALAGVEVVDGTLAVDAPDLRCDVSTLADIHVIISRMESFARLPA